MPIEPYHVRYACMIAAALLMTAVLVRVTIDMRRS